MAMRPAQLRGVGGCIEDSPEMEAVIAEWERNGRPKDAFAPVVAACKPEDPPVTARISIRRVRGRTIGSGQSGHPARRTTLNVPRRRVDVDVYREGRLHPSCYEPAYAEVVRLMRSG